MASCLLPWILSPELFIYTFVIILTTMSTDLSDKINTIMERELQSLAASILDKQCGHLNIDPDNIKPENLPVLAHRLSEMMRTLGGYDKAKRVYAEIRKLKDLDELAEEETSEVARQDVLENLAKASLFAAEWDKALEYFHKLLDEAKTRNDILAKSRYLRWLGILHKDRSEYESALALLEKALAAAIEYGADNQISKCRSRIGDIHWYRGDFANALQSYELAAEKGEGDDVGIAHIGIGNVHGSRKDFSKAIEHYKEALVHLEDTDNFQGISRTYNNLGDTFLQLEDWDNALDYFSKGEEIGDKGGCLNITAFTKFNMAEVHIKKGELDKAEEMLDESMKLLREIDSKPGLAGVYHVYGLLYRARKDWEKMIYNYRTAVEMYTEIDVPQYAAKCMFELGQGYVDMGEAEKAKEEFDQAVDIYKRLKVDSMVEVVQREIENA